MDDHDIHTRLRLIEESGWDSSAGHELLVAVRVGVVQPVVRRSGLRGPAADQAASSAWAAAWDALRRPSARTADNPMGMAWVAAKRAVATEMSLGGAVRDSPRQESSVVSIDVLIAGGWSPVADPPPTDRGPLGPTAGAIVEALVEAGWTRDVIEDAVRLLAELATDQGGVAVAPWRCVANALGIAHWRVRRLASLLLGGTGRPGLVELVVSHGPGILADPVIEQAMQSTTRRSRPGPETALRGWDDLHPGGDTGEGSREQGERCA